MSTTNTMTWISVEDALPSDGQAVLVCRKGNNWLSDHILADGTPEQVWRWQAAKFMKGVTADEVKSKGFSRQQDEAGNNTKPYCWADFGPSVLFGQEVSHWAAITAP